MCTDFGAASYFTAEHFFSGIFSMEHLVKLIKSLFGEKGEMFISKENYFQKCSNRNHLIAVKRL